MPLLILDAVTILQRALLGPPQTNSVSQGVNVTGINAGGSPQKEPLFSTHEGSASQVGNVLRPCT